MMPLLGRQNRVKLRLADQPVHVVSSRTVKGSASRKGELHLRNETQGCSNLHMHSHAQACASIHTGVYTHIHAYRSFWNVIFPSFV